MRHVILVLLASFSLLGGAPVFADHDRVRMLRQAGEILPLTEILKRVPEASTGQVLGVELEEKRGHLLYELEILTSNGHVLEIYVDARNGVRVEEKEEDD